MTINLRPLFAREARSAIDASLVRAHLGLGFAGASLAPLADGRTAGPAIANLLQAEAQVAVTADGFEVSYQDPRLIIFDSGTRRQPARPVIGLDPAAAPAITARATREVAAQITRALRSA